METRFALLAAELFVSAVSLEVLLEVTFLNEGRMAIWLLTDVWSFAGVDSEVILEVVPLAELSSARAKLALQNAEGFVG